MDFTKLWNAYPTEYSPCHSSGTPNFENQCAIRFGLSLMNGGVNLSRFPGVRCWHGHNGQHLLRGEELAAWMYKNPRVFGTCEIRRDSDHTTYSGRVGLLFCRNFWGPGSQGDHIDLWNRDHMKTGFADYISRSQEVWFWGIGSSDHSPYSEGFDFDAKAKKGEKSKGSSRRTRGSTKKTQKTRKPRKSEP